MTVTIGLRLESGPVHFALVAGLVMPAGGHRAPAWQRFKNWLRAAGDDLLVWLAQPVWRGGTV